MSIQTLLLDPLLMETVSVESPTITSHNIDNTKIVRRNNLKIAVVVDKALNSLRIYRPQNTTKVYLPKQKEWKISNIFFYFRSNK